MPWDRARTDENVQLNRASTFAGASIGATGNYFYIARGDIPLPAEGTGKKVYWEVYYWSPVSVGTAMRCGLATASAPSSGTGAVPASARLGGNEHTIGISSAFVIIRDNVTEYTPSATAPATSIVSNGNDTIRFAYEADTRRLWMGHSFNAFPASWQKQASPAAGTNWTYVVPSGQTWYPAISIASNQSAVLQDGHLRTHVVVPNGFSTLASSIFVQGSSSIIEHSKSTTIVTDLTLRASCNSGATGQIFFLSNGPTQNKYYWEVAASQVTAGLATQNGFGIIVAAQQRFREDLKSFGIAWTIDGNVTGFTTVYGSALAGTSTFTNGDRLMFALDRTKGYFYIGKNGTWMKSADPSTPSSTAAYAVPVLEGDMTDDNSLHYIPAGFLTTTNHSTMYMKQTEWLYSAPSGFVEYLTQDAGAGAGRGPRLFIIGM